MSGTSPETGWMKRALSLAKRAKRDVRHYPMVGAVVVKGGRIIGEGYFRRPGEDHAEVKALKKAGTAAKGSTLVLNLEPCSHYGSTPPCAKAVIEAGVKRVVAAMKDPNPLVAGKGFAMLKKAGIEVETGVMEDEAREINRHFIKYITENVPWVTMKAAITLDGKIATKKGDSCWITGEPARELVHKMRGEHQAIMVGSNTVREDDCRLTCRVGKRPRHPRPVIVTSALDIPENCAVMTSPAEGGPLLITTRRAPEARIEKFRKMGAEVAVVRKDNQGHADLIAVMAELGKRKIATVMMEGGSSLFGSALRLGIVDEVAVFVAPKVLGGDGLPVTSGPSPMKIADCLKLSGLSSRKVGDDILLTGRVIK